MKKALRKRIGARKRLGPTPTTSSRHQPRTAHSWPHPRARLSAKAGGVQATGGGPSIVVAPEFTDGSNCDIAEAVREPHSMTPAQLKLTRARKTVRAVRFFAPLA